MLRAPDFPRAIGGAYRLDTLRAWEERQLAGSVAASPAEPAAPVDADHLTALAPTPSGTVPGIETAPATSRDGDASWSPSTRRPASVRARRTEASDGPSAEGRDQAGGAIRIGRRRVRAGGRGWNLRAYSPTDVAPFGRITFYPTGKTHPTTRTPRPGQSLDELFEHHETLLDAQVAVGFVSAGDDVRHIEALCALYLQDLSERGRDEAYIDNRRCIIGKWITPLIGPVLVAQTRRHLVRRQGRTGETDPPDFRRGAASAPAVGARTWR